MGSQRIAAIDLGTNTARLLIADRLDNGAFEQVYLQRTIVRLGGGFDKASGLAADAIERALSCLGEFKRQIDHRGVTTIRAVATSAVRDAANGRQFVEQVARATGISLAVIDGQIEGQITMLGVLAGLDPRPDALFMFDVGGGSTEYTLTGVPGAPFVRSLPLGVVRLTEGKGDAAAIAEKTGRELDSLVQQINRAGVSFSPASTTLVGTAGTATTLAAISLGMEEYDYRKVNNFLLELGEIRRIYQLLTGLSPLERLKVAGLEPGREDLIIAGTVVTMMTMERFGFERMTVSDYGLLEGLVVAGPA